MQVKLELLIAFLTHLRSPRGVRVRPATFDSNIVFIGDEQSSVISEDCLYKLNGCKIYSISKAWLESLRELMNDPNSFPEFRSQYAMLLKRHPFEQEKPKEVLLPPFENVLQPVTSTNHNRWSEDVIEFVDEETIDLDAIEV